MYLVLFPEGNACFRNSPDFFFFSDDRPMLRNAPAHPLCMNSVQLHHHFVPSLHVH